MSNNDNGCTSPQGEPPAAVAQGPGPVVNTNKAKILPVELNLEESDDGDENSEDEELSREESSTQKSFKERAVQLMKKSQGENSHLVGRKLRLKDWLFIHRIMRKSKGLKSKFMIRNLTPILFDSKYVAGWKCKFCKELIPSPAEEYLEHLRTHNKCNSDDDDDEDPLFPCDVCGDYLKREKYVVHWVPHFMEHECPVCHKSFALNCHLKYHYKVVHEEGEQTCYQCGKLLKNDLAMRRHLRLYHSNRTTWKNCDICGKRVKSRCLEPHRLTHSQDRPYKCDICKKRFKTPSTLYQHQKVHATDSKAHKYLCEYCGKRFKHHTSWSLHVVRIHEGEYEHECPVCKKRFHKLFELKKHSVKHSDERPFPCSVCNKQFKTKTHLKEHLTTHSEEKSHICPLCGKGIRMKANLYKHLKVHRNRGEYVPPLNGSSSTALFNGSPTVSSVTASSTLDQLQPQAQVEPLQDTANLSVHVDTLTAEAPVVGTSLEQSFGPNRQVELSLPATLLPNGSLVINGTPPTPPIAMECGNPTHFLIINTGSNASININKTEDVKLPPARDATSNSAGLNIGSTSGSPSVSYLTILLTNGPITLSPSQLE